MFCYGSRLPDALEAVIDESGDAGTGGKGTRWLVIALVADLGERDELPSLLESIRSEVQRAKRHLHFAEIKSVAKKINAYQQLAKAPVATIVVAIDTAAIAPPSGLAKRGRLYSYGLMLLLERASRLAASLERPLAVTIEKSPYVQAEQLRTMLHQLRDDPRRRGSAMQWDWIDISGIRTRTKASDSRLGAADATSHAFFRALEPKFAGDPTALMYADILHPTLWRGIGEEGINGRGFIFAPASRARHVIAVHEALQVWLIDEKQVAPLLWHHHARRR